MLIIVNGLFEQAKINKGSYENLYKLKQITLSLLI
jgi:hypothetical protein